MKRKLLTMITLMILIVSICATNALAAAGTYSYGCTARCPLGTEWNGSGRQWTFNAKAYPTGNWAVTRLQLCDPTGSTVYAWNDYPVNPVNPGWTSCPIYDNQSIRTYVKPVPNGNYISGTVEWNF